ncbi:DUF6683 family protein [Pseudoduganella violaceinigra]|uniref:DUF6683 family protein n=1 Tax=Pseudoduganella violaceinigra TaxID=246602 RepID=UPI000425FDE7|nr:DUF6683 family protein [Pseudoduganella violaceinigra]
MKLNITLKALLLASALMAGQAAQAQWLGQDYATFGVPLVNFGNMAAMNNNSMNTGKHTHSDTDSRSARASAPPAVQRNAQELSKVFPAASQASMRQAFQQSMDVYQQIAEKMGWQRNDLDGAMAAFIVGNYMVFANRDVQDAEFAAVAEQLRRGAGTRRLAERQSAESIRDLYEKSAMVGAFMALAYKSQQQKSQQEHVAANLRNSARENLKLVLGTDPERLRISERGVMLAE